MTEARSTQRKPVFRLPRLRRRTLLGAATVLTLLLVLGVAFVLLPSASERAFREAAAEADRLDPGWRFEDLWKAREVVPDAENAARVVEKAEASLPQGWAGNSLENRLRMVPPEQRLDDETAAELRAVLKPLDEAIREARRLADFPRGRFEVELGKNLFEMKLPHGDKSREVQRLLALDSTARAEGGDFEGAMRSAIACFNAGTAFGDEPLIISQLVRVMGTNRALDGAERVLAQGEVSDATLARWQGRLAEEARAPLLLTALRGERSTMNDVFEKIHTGDLTIAALPDIGSHPLARLVFHRGIVRENQAYLVRQMTRAVEAAKQPDGRAVAELEAMEKEYVAERARSWAIDKFRRAPADVLMPAVNAAAAFCVRSHTYLATARVAMGAERFRLAEGRWPKSLDELVPRFLDAVPEDPYSGSRLHFAPTAEGVVIYSVGPDQTDDGGNISRGNPAARGNDFGVRLWDVEKRRRAPSPETDEER